MLLGFAAGNAAVSLFEGLTVPREWTAGSNIAEWTVGSRIGVVKNMDYVVLAVTPPEPEFFFEWFF